MGQAPAGLALEVGRAPEAGRARAVELASEAGLESEVAWVLELELEAEEPDQVAALAQAEQEPAEGPKHQVSG